jgi:GrpB-like predicted nucleotidyltransferase (UPF0157 family)
MIEIVPYRLSWPAEFDALAQELQGAIGLEDMYVAHIGSTAVPMLAAKDRIDIQLAVPDLAQTNPLMAALTSLGYREKPGITGDHLPPGLETNQNQWSKRFAQSVPKARAVNIHIRQLGCRNARYPLLFRDYLRTHSEAAAAYVAVKRALAQHGPENWNLYYAVKDPVCDIIMAGAEAWATAAGWEPNYGRRLAAR